MQIWYSPKFIKQFRKLSNEIKELAQQKLEFFKIDPFDSRLKTHKLSGRLKDCYSFSIDYKHRIMIEFIDKNTIYFHAIGTHDIYE